MLAASAARARACLSRSVSAFTAATSPARALSSVASVALTAGGSGYTSAPPVTVSGGGGTGAVVTAALAARGVGTIAVTAGGSGYTSAPTVALTGGGGTGATAVATLAAGGVAAITLTSGGTGYTGVPTVVLSGGGGTGAAAVAVLPPTSVASVAVTTGGAYGAQTTLASSVGQPACFAVDSSGRIYFGLASTGANTSLDIYRLTPGGSPSVFASIPGGYSFGGVEGLAFDLSGNLWIADWEYGELFFVGPGGGTATDVRTLAGSVGGMTCGPDGHLYITIYTTGVVQKYVIATDTITTFASGLSSPIGICADASGNLYVAQWGSSQLKKITTGGTTSDFANIGSQGVDVAFASDGQMYAIGWGNNLQVVSPAGVATAYFAGSGITQPLALVAGVTGFLYVAGVASSGSIFKIGVRPSVTLSGGGGSGAAATARMSGGSTNAISSIVVFAAGSGYTSAPSVAIDGSGGGAATAVLTGVAIASVSVTAPGSGYATAPTAAFSGGGGSGATATVGVSNVVAAITITNPGSGYSTPPTVGLSGGAGSGAAATATLAGGPIASLTLTAPGSGFSSLPTLTFSGGGSGATGTLTLTPTTVASLTLAAGGGGLRLNDLVVLTRTEGAGSPVTWFRGHVRRPPRRLTPAEEIVTYEVEGPWQWLERTPYLQNFKTPANPDDTASALVSYLRGRAILHQNNAGAKITAQAFLTEILDYCADAVLASEGFTPFAAAVSADFAVTLPWEEVNDLSCADAVARVLSLLQDAVAWFDYSANPPVLHIDRRSALSALTLPIAEPGGSSEFATARRDLIELAPLPEQQRTGVVLIYIATNRANEAAWETYTIDKYPSTAVPNSPRTLVRTIQLAGGVASSNVLTQKVSVDPIPSVLVASDDSVINSGDGGFAALSAWWKKHSPDLKKSNVTIKSFRRRRRTDADGSAVYEDLTNELIKGSVTDWMEDVQEIFVEDQLVEVQVDVELADPVVSARKERQVWPLSVIIRATNAATQTYRFTAGGSSTPPEPVPSGLAQAIHAAISPLHYEGSIALVEREPTVRQLLGRVVNLTGELAAWETMTALIQQATIDLDRGETSLQVGPPRHLGIGELIDIFRSNRTRPAASSWETRTSGRSGSTDTEQGISYHLPVSLVASREPRSPRIFTQALSVAGVVPTSGEVTTALSTLFDTEIPTAGDQAILTVGGVPKLRYRITLTNIGTSGISAVSFTPHSVTYYGLLTQIGLY